MVLKPPAGVPSASYVTAQPNSAASFGARRSSLPSTSAWLSSQSDKVDTWRFGISSKCTGAAGLISLKASKSSSSYTTVEGIFLAAILQKIQLSTQSPGLIRKGRTHLDAPLFHRDRTSLRGAPVHRAPVAASNRTGPASPGYETTGRRTHTILSTGHCRAAHPWRPSPFLSLPRRFFSGSHHRPWRTAAPRRRWQDRRHWPACAIRSRPPGVSGFHSLLA